MKQCSTGMLGGQARRHHQLKHNFQGDVLADRRVNPTLNSVVSLRARWLAQNNTNEMSVLDAMRKIKANKPQHLIDFAETPFGYVAVLVTEFMYRIHQKMEAASKVVLVDSSYVDKINCCLIILVCSSAAGALPLGVILSSTQSKEDYVRGIYVT